MKYALFCSNQIFTVNIFIKIILPICQGCFTGTVKVNIRLVASEINLEDICKTGMYQTTKTHNKTQNISYLLTPRIYCRS